MGDVFLDVETERGGAITVCGVARAGLPMVQLVAPLVTAASIVALVPLNARLYTFNGHGFDLPLIKKLLGVDLRSRCFSVDLMVSCAAAGLKGGQKAIEAEIRKRRDPAVKARVPPNCFDLWDRWKLGEKAALDELLAYNAEDLTGMQLIRDVMMLAGKIKARFG